MRRDVATLPIPRQQRGEADLHYYYTQVEVLWLAGLATTFEQIQEHLPPTERAELTDGLAALVARNWLKLQPLPLSHQIDQADYEICYVPVRPSLL